MNKPNPKVDAFLAGAKVPVGPCPTQPRSVRDRWDESLLITDLHVVQDPCLLYTSRCV